MYNHPRSCHMRSHANEYNHGEQQAHNGTIAQLTVEIQATKLTKKPVEQETARHHKREEGSVKVRDTVSSDTYRA